MSAPPQTVLDAEAIMAFLRRCFPDIDEAGYAVDAVAPGTARLRQRFLPRMLRPGGTISGPTLMALADTAMFALVLAHIGPEPMAVTVSLEMQFLRRPAPGDLVAQARLLKLGRRLAVGVVEIAREGDDAPVAHATVTYARPEQPTQPG